MKEPESVASHMFRMAMMAFLFGGDGDHPPVNRERYLVSTRYGALLTEKFCLRCIKMALVHDLAESIVGDLLPNEVTKEEKYRREMVDVQTCGFRFILASYAQRYRKQWITSEHWFQKRYH